MGQSTGSKRDMDTTGGSIGKLDATIATSSPPSHEQRKRRGKDMGYTKILPDTAKRRPPAAGKGRPKGALNKTTAALKDMILAALDNVGGVEYLERQAVANPTAFLTLAGKVLPLQVAGQLDHKVKVEGALKWQAPQ